MSELIYLPLDQLVLSDLNVRRTVRDADVDSLADDIASRGLKQNLIVVPADPATAAIETAGRAVEGLHEVIGGGRRLQAMRLLREDGRLPADHMIACLPDDREQARETSLSENLHRVAMNPADEFEAFAVIVADRGGGPDAVAACAKRFGKTAPYVEGRMRLANLAPEILEALREDRIGIEAAKAYAVLADHKLQLQVFKEREKDTWHGHKPQTIRDRMRGKTLPLTDPRLIFVGLKAYLEAGGRTEVEMFLGATAEERLVDVGKLEKLVKEKAEALIPAQAKKDGYKEGVFAQGHGWQVRWPKAPKEFERAHDYYGKKPTKAQLKKSVGVYVITGDGKGIKLEGRFKPKSEEANSNTGYRQKTADELAAERREREINRTAAQLAVGKFAGTPLEGRAFWPSRNWIDPIEQVSEDEVMVAVLVKVTRSDVEAQRGAAIAKFEADLAEAEAAKIAEAQKTAAEEGCDMEDALSEIDEEEDQVAA